MTIWGCKTDLVKDDKDNTDARKVLLKQYPDAVELDRSPSKYETYVHGVGYVKDTDQETIDQAESVRQSELDTEFESAGIKGKSKQQIQTKLDNLVNPADPMEDQIAGLKLIIMKIAMKLAKEK